MRWLFKTGSVIAGLIIISFTTAYAQDLATAEAEVPEYVDVLKKRADKIVNTLDILDPAKEDKVRDIIVMQYYNLSKIHDARDNQIKALEKQNEDDNVLENRTTAITRKAEQDIKKLHTEYIAQLSGALSASQVDKVKDGMTYGVLPLTYKAYLNLLPDLTQEEKKTIKEYLVTARELAMDEGSSERKHHCFGQYKGKINNFLSARGYDLKEAEKALKERNEAK